MNRFLFKEQPWLSGYSAEISLNKPGLVSRELQSFVVLRQASGQNSSLAPESSTLHMGRSEPSLMRGMRVVTRPQFVGSATKSSLSRVMLHLLWSLKEFLHDHL